MEYNYNGFVIKPSTRLDKKYDVFDEQGYYILSYGSRSNEHYKDYFGYYSNLDHNDDVKRMNFNKRFSKLIQKFKENPFSSMYWSYHFLWDGNNK
jgi:hypothetical protein